MFTSEFMTKFQTLWNQDETIPTTLKSINFSANVGYGIKGEDKPQTVLIVKEGSVVDAKLYEGEELDWDIRCSEDNWKHYMVKGMGMSALASAYAMGWMKFIRGDYLSMIKNPRMVGPFIKSFELMSRVYKEMNQ